MKICLNSTHSILLQLKSEVIFLEIRFVRNLFDSIQKFAIRLIRKVKENLKNTIPLHFYLIVFILAVYLFLLLNCYIFASFVRDLKNQHFIVLTQNSSHPILKCRFFTFRIHQNPEEPVQQPIPNKVHLIQSVQHLQLAR